MSETIKLCAMLARAVFENDDEAREPFVEQAMRAKREHDEMRRELAEARRAVDNIGDAYDRLVSAVVGGVASAAYCFDTSEYEKQAERLRADIEQADTTRREWEVRAATSYAAGRAAGLREAMGACRDMADALVLRANQAAHMSTSHRNAMAGVVAVERAMGAIAALAPPAAETVRDFVDGNPPKAERRNGTPAAEPRDEGES